ncbi:hypothetical protein LNP05_16125 [Klebsiella pneumoniae subsp. pneumoniae]|nr:hypothetical protein [Klebsiella pneumoniae subsp. pneumoniae]
MALGVVWTGGAWFTGKQLEGRIADMCAAGKRPAAQRAPESGLELSYQGLPARAVQQPSAAGGEADQPVRLTAGWPPGRAWCLTKWSIMAPSRWPR